LEERAGERRSVARSYEFVAIFDAFNKAKWLLEYDTA
jgi:hypothetical protein